MAHSQGATREWHGHPCRRGEPYQEILGLGMRPARDPR